MEPDCRDEAEPVKRRAFLSRISIALSAAAVAVASVPPLVYVFGPLARQSPDVWRPVGPVEQFEVGETVEVIFADPSPQAWAGVTARTGAWLRRTSAGEFVAFSLSCTHLGCPVRWLQDADLFMCPCHGGVYYRDGSVAAGPPPEPLKHHAVRVRKGQVEIFTRPIPIIG